MQLEQTFLSLEIRPLLLFRTHAAILKHGKNCLTGFPSFSKLLKQQKTKEK